jgi:DNA-binding transcriptional MerR regulator
MVVTAPVPALSIAAAALVTGLSPHTLRYYERAGLMLEPIARATSSHRRYSEAEVEWVTFLTKLRSTGMPIRTMRRYADLVREGSGTETERLELLQSHRRTVQAQVEAAANHLKAIDYKISLYQERTTH